ncbi:MULTISPECIES: branched-chain amino acid ABC transporter substrate-binding protein [unclassified Micromonospora]|uniref:branched-chain amino acid ABC transporter substrate-binding protein n=1 Tax=unclassified Micromonospora TaxID=2617518 RepID=UPI00124B596A|nr:branched-chain amino acid ABC transporter substrate-binding protein [Micromonospora sp. AMSO31t]KAB1915744.1 branched-chain amino acid ABC transporter substrate-binding protein [Micromonospora sp. AMSO31t]
MTAYLTRRLSRVALVGGAAVAAMMLSACGNGLASGGGEQSSDKGPIVLGMLTPLSGSSSAIGPYMKNGAQLAVDEINGKGGVDGRKLELKVEDEACDAKSATAGANKLVTAGVKISVGGYCSGATLPTLPIFEKADVPMLIPAANSNELVKQHKKNVFLINGTGAQQSDAAFTFMKKVGATKVALMDDNTSYSKDIADTTAKLLTGSPALAGRESVTAGESDYSANVTAILKGQPDFIYWTGYYQEGGLIIRQLRQAGYTGKVMVADGSVDQKLVDIAGSEAAEGVFATMTQTPETIQGADKWIADYKSKFGAAPGPYSTQAYDAVRVAAEAVKQAGSTDGSAVIKALEGIDGFQLFSGPLKFTPDHTLSSGGFQILTVEKGKIVLKDTLQ